MIRALALVLALLAAVPSAAAADGRALVVAGRVMLERAAPGASSVTALAAGSEIRSGDLIRTGSDGRVQIRFSDGSIVALQPGTTFRIDEYRYEGNERRAFFYLLRGALRTVTGAIGKTDHDAEYRMKTPTATVGVRGTEYVAEQTVCDPRCAPGPRPGLRVAVTQGRIALVTGAGAIDVDAGGSAAAESADAPPQPTERGPMLPPISYSPSRERTTGAPATASADRDRAPAPKAESRGASTAQPATAAPVAAGSGEPDGRAPSAGSASGAETTGAADPAADPSSGAWPRFVVTETGAPAARVSPNERRGPDGALLPVVERLGPGAQSPTGEGSAGGPTDPESGLPGGGTPPASGKALSAGVHRIDAAATPGTGPTLRVLDPWGLPIDARVREGSLELDADLRLNAFQWCRNDSSCRVAKGTAKVMEAGHDDWTSWGRWTGGRIVAATGLHLDIADDKGLHYLVGVPSTTVPTSGVFGYELVGSTQATLSGGGAPGRFDGRAAVAFSPSGARVGIDASVSFPGSIYSFATPGGIGAPEQSPLATGVGHAFGGRLTTTAPGPHAPLDCAAGCPVRIEGGLFGPDAARLGITYRITGTGDGGSTISGVGVFGRKDP